MPKDKWTTGDDGLAQYDGKIYIPDDPAIRATILRVNHDDPWTGGHFGEARTTEVIQRCFWWPGLRKEANEYVRTCDVCQRMKVPRQRAAGLLAPLELPKEPWTDIAMDFIVGLPPSKHRRQVYDAVLVVVDRYSKMARLVPCT